MSIKEFGWQQPIVVDADGVIIAGHTRLLAAKKLGMTEVPVRVARNLTPAQVKAYRLMDNRSHEEATWDDHFLKLEVLDLAPGDRGGHAFDSGRHLHRHARLGERYRRVLRQHAGPVLRVSFQATAQKTFRVLARHRESIVPVNRQFVSGHDPRVFGPATDLERFGPVADGVRELLFDEQ